MICLALLTLSKIIRFTFTATDAELYGVNIG